MFGFVGREQELRDLAWTLDQVRAAPGGRAPGQCIQMRGRRRIGTIRYAACCGAIERMDLRDRLPAITAPTLVIAGAQDAATPREHAERIVAGMSNASLAVLDPAAHLAPVEQPATFADLVVSHLSKDAS